MRTLCWSEIISCRKAEGLTECLLEIYKVVWLSLSLIEDKTFLKESRLKEKDLYPPVSFQSPAMLLASKISWDRGF